MQSPSTDANVTALTLTTLAKQMSVETEKIMRTYLWKWHPSACGIQDTKALANYVREQGGSYSVVDTQRSLDGTVTVVYCYANSKTKEIRCAEITLRTTRKNPSDQQVLLEVGHKEIPKPENIGIQF